MNQRVRICLSALATLLLLFSLGCRPPKAVASTSSETADQLGRPVKLDKVPQRIISLAPSNTEILFALGLGDRVVGVTDYDDYPPEAKQKPSIGGFATPNIEKIVALSPDLVLAASFHEKQVVPGLEQRGITVFALAPKTTDDTLQAITLVGKITGKSTEASQLVSDMKKRIDAVTNKTNKLAGNQIPGVLYIVWHDPLTASGAGTFQDELIQKAGGRNIAHELSGYPRMSLEVVIEQNPAVIIAGVGHGEDGSGPLLFAREDARLKNTAARVQGRIYSADANLANRAGPRIVDALEQFAQFIHPELFPAK